MIISHRHEFIFFAVPKTATHTIREALRQHLVPDDWEQQTLFGQQALPIPDIARIQHGHISVRQIRPNIEPAIWGNYFKFAFVRNPFDRFVSTCFFLNRNNLNFKNSAVGFMKQRLQFNKFRERVLVMPQSELLIDDNRQIAVDYVGRYENLQRSYDEICDRIGVPTTLLGLKNPSDHAAFREYYDDELRDVVGKFYEADLRLFGYEFEPSEPTN